MSAIECAHVRDDVHSTTTVMAENKVAHTHTGYFGNGGDARGIAREIICRSLRSMKGGNQLLL